MFSTVASISRPLFIGLAIVLPDAGGSESEAEMALFGRRPQADDPPSDLTQALADSIRHRGTADIPEAESRVARFVAEILQDSGTAHIPAAESWIRERLRFFILVGVSPGWMSLVAQASPEAEQLRAEHLMLAREVDRFGPERLVAWWIHLSPQLFGQGLDHQFGEMRGALTDMARQYSNEPSMFASDRVDWDSLFDDGGLLAGK